MLCVCVFFLVVLIYQVHLPGKCSLFTRYYSDPYILWKQFGPPRPTFLRPLHLNPVG